MTSNIWFPGSGEPRPYRALPLRVLLCLSMAFFCLPYAYAQRDSIFGVIKSPGAQEPYGINDLGVLKSQTTTTESYPYATRHHRRVEESGIGGSFVDTTSDTAESSAAVVPHSIEPVVREAMPMSRQLKSMYGNLAKTSALSDTLNEPSFHINSSIGRRKLSSSPALNNFPEPSWSMIESALIKKPAQVCEPIERINLHRTGGSTSLPY
jgi:hypothetical protein